MYEGAIDRKIGFLDLSNHSFKRYVKSNLISEVVRVLIEKCPQILKSPAVRNFFSNEPSFKSTRKIGVVFIFHMSSKLSFISPIIYM